MDNTTVGYALGMVEGYLEGLRDAEVSGAQEILDYLKVIEQGYIQKTAEVFAQQSKLEAIQLNLQGWRKDV